MTNHQSGMGGACYKVNSSVALHAEMLQIMRCIEQQAVGLYQVEQEHVTPQLQWLTLETDS